MGGICGASGEIGPPEQTRATLVSRKPNSAGPFGARRAVRRLGLSDLERGDRRHVEREPAPAQAPELFAA